MIRFIKALLAYIWAWIKFHAKIFWLMFPILIICTACHKTDKIDNIVQNANNAITTLEKTLTPDCATAEIKARLDAIKTQIITIQAVCAQEKEVLKADKAKWRALALGVSFVVLLVIGLWLGKRI